MSGLTNLKIVSKNYNGRWIKLLHDIKTPLTVIITATEIINSDDEETRKNLAKIRNGAVKVSKILQQMDQFVNKNKS